MNRTYSRLLVVALVGAGLPTYLSYGRGQDRLLSLPSAADTRSTSGIAASPVSTSGASDEERSVERPPIRPDLFFPPAPPEEPPHAAPAQAPVTPPAPVTAPIVVALEDPLANYVYNASMTANGESTALIEHRKSKQGWLVREGDTWQNYRIIAVTDQQIKILVDGQEQILARSDAINIVPLRTEAGQTPASPKDATPTFETPVNTTVWMMESDGMELTNVTLSTGFLPQNRLSAVEIAHIKSEAFEGRITGEEAERRLSQRSFPTLNDHYFLLSNTPTNYW